jgi:hypothetical protein
MQSVGDLMTFVDEVFDGHCAVEAKANGSGVTWEFAFTVTDGMKAASRQRNAHKWKAVEGFLKSCEKLSLPEILGTKR